MNREEIPFVLDVSDIMNIMKVGRNNAYEIMNEIGFTVKKEGRLKRVSRDKFLAWLENNEAS